MYHNLTNIPAKNILVYTEAEIKEFLSKPFRPYKTAVERTFFIENRNVALHLVNLAIFLDLRFEYTFTEYFHTFLFCNTPVKIDELDQRWAGKKKQIMEKTGIERIYEKEAEEKVFNDFIKSISYNNPTTVEIKPNWQYHSISSGNLPIFTPDGNLLINNL